MAGAHTGMGAIVSIGDGNSPENFIPVMGIKNVKPLGISRSTHDTTDMSGNNWKTFIGGLVDGGEVSFDANWLPRDPSQSQASGGLMAEFDRSSCDSLRNIRIDVPECPGEAPAYIAMAAIFSGMDIDMQMDDLMSFAGTFKVSGRPELVIETT